MEDDSAIGNDRANVSAVDTSRPFTRAHALEAGLSPRVFRGSRFRRLFRGVYIDANKRPDRHDRIAAGLLLHPEGARASHLSAGSLYRLPVPDHSDVHISVVDPKDRRWQPGLKPHVSPPGQGIRHVDGLPASEPIRMFVELASVLNLVDLVVVGDAMSRILGLRAGELRARLIKTRDYWSPAARAAAVYVRDEVDSPMESRLRMLLVLAGLPEPVINLKLRNRSGEVILRFELSYPAYKVAVEYEGRQHAESPQQWEWDIDRREFLDRDGWRIVLVTARGIYNEPWRTLDRVVSTLRERGANLAVVSNDWRPFFPGRPSIRPA